MVKDSGIYKKFIIERTDGQSKPGGRHFGCEYFVLDLEHDRYAGKALEAYADEYPLLAKDIRDKVQGMNQ